MLGILAVVLSLAFAYAAEILVPASGDRRQILSVMATMSATLLGLLLAATTFVFQIHRETLQSPLGMAAGITRGMQGFWQTATRVLMGLAFSVVASLFGLLDLLSIYSLYAMILAGIGLICAVLFIWLLVSDLWGVLRASQS